MALKEINLSDLVDQLDAEQSDYADFFRPMQGYDAVLKLYEGIDDSCEPLITEIEDETGYEFPPDLISFYMCSNGGEFGDIQLYPISKDSSLNEDIHRLNVFDKSLKEEIGLNTNTLLVGKYMDSSTYITCVLNEEDVYVYSLWDATKKTVTMEFEYLIQLIALEISYNIDNEGFMEIMNNKE